MSRSTFSILPYINRQKVKADGTANILCRITVDGKSAAISTGISCTPQEWNAKKGEVRNARDSGRLAGFLAEVKDKYNSLLSTNGIITVEMLKAVLKDKDTTGRFLLNFGDAIVEPMTVQVLCTSLLHSVPMMPRWLRMPTSQLSTLLIRRARPAQWLTSRVSSISSKTSMPTS